MKPSDYKAAFFNMRGALRKYHAEAIKSVKDAETKNELRSIFSDAFQDTNKYLGPEDQADA